MAVHLFLSSLTQGVIVLNEDATDVLYWLVGSINGKNWSHVLVLLPWSVFGLLAAFIMGRSISILVLGENMATGLGEKVQWIRLVAGVIVIILAGSSVAVAGPIGFIGLMVPHIARKLVGGDYQRILPFSALLGGTLLVYADILSRFIAYPFESPVGIVTALIGAPFFYILLERGGRLNNERKKHPYGILSILLLILVMMAFISLGIGAVYTSPVEVFTNLIGSSQSNHFILFNYRIPRMLLAVIVGASLAVSGAILQGILKIH